MYIYINNMDIILPQYSFLLIISCLDVSIERWRGRHSLLSEYVYDSTCMYNSTVETVTIQ